jgi:SAM-dependent methyltransferase
MESLKKVVLKIDLIRVIYKYLRFWGGPYRCNVCSTQLRRFFPVSIDLRQRAKASGFPYEFSRMETLNFEQCNCPFCLASDRERLYLMYLEQYATENDNSILEFAPHPPAAKLLKEKYQHYKTADLMRKDVDIQLDICDMKEIKDNSFDFVLCSHVLEHVSDCDKAMREILRILKPDGQAIIMVPLFWDVKSTLEDPSHNTDELRLKHYAQEDHVRLFARQDFLDRLNKAGFKINQLLPSSFDQKKVKEYAIADNSILYVCSKN